MHVEAANESADNLVRTDGSCGVGKGLEAGRKVRILTGKHANREGYLVCREAKFPAGEFWRVRLYAEGERRE